MTREEAINRLRDMIAEIRAICDESKHMSEDDRQDMETFDMAIKALEQEPFINKPCVSSGVCEYDKNKILDRIRAEIEQLPTNTKTNWDGCCLDIDYPEIEYVDVTKKQLLYIIDKYKAESEG